MNTNTRNAPQKSNQWNRSLLFTLCTGLVACLLIPPVAFSQWSGNHLVSNAAGDQINTASVSDGAGGTIIAWQDKRSGDHYDIYAQRISSTGEVQWVTNGIAICTSDSDQVKPAIITDGSGGAIIAWQDKRNDSYDIYAQRVDASGVLQWNPSTGVSVCDVVFDQVGLAMVSDGSGGALLAWEDYRSNAGPGLADVYSQKLSAAGIAQWMANGVGVCTQAAAQHGPRIISDGAGGAFLTWFDQRAGDYDIYAQRVESGGGLTGITDGVAVCTSGTDQTNPDICSDGAGGVIIVWQDFRSTTSIDIWVQRMSAAVSILWPVNGVVMNNNVAYDQVNPKLVSDGAGGAVMTWEDFRTGITSDIYAQRVDVTGVVATGWDVNGVTVCVSAGNQSNPQTTSDGNGGAIITWADKRDSSTNGNTYDIYASRITGDFSLPWTPNGVPICVVDSNQTQPTAVIDGSGGAIVAWQDKRGSTYDIYASRVFQNGTTPVEIAGATPAGFTLSQNSPNPFNPSTRIQYSLEKPVHVSLRVYNLLGTEVALLVNGRQEAGEYIVQFNTNSGPITLPSGVYLYRLEAGTFAATKKLIFMK